MPAVPTWTVGDRLRKSLDVAHISVQEMADYLGLSRNTVTNYMHDHTTAPGPVLRLWAYATDVPLRWLETGEEVEEPDRADRDGPLRVLVAV